MADKPRDPAMSVWLTPPKRKKRGSAPTGLSRERIIDTAVALLDSEGIDAFSMRRLAAELDVTPMSVYWYVDSKDDLLELALDAAFGTMKVPPLEDHGDWRRHVYVMAHEYRKCYLEHPWAAEMVGRYLSVGPNAMLLSSSVMSALSGTGLTGDALAGAVALVFQFAYGVAMAESMWARRVRQQEGDEDTVYRQMQDMLSEHDSRFTVWEQQFGYDRRQDFASARNRQFDQGLEMALAGIEAAIAALPKGHG
ncbi:TetR/AcrR family transcriptional regulator [Kitasatospora acidiphila]|nr:TetR/AcrR family transcriptional regulator C-terminal domain-containing protein [Kitasatospora acidiphila]